MPSLIEYSHAQFHTLPTIPISNIVEENEKFGIISLKIKKTNITTIPTLFLFTIDTTGSMSEYAYKTVSKLAVVKQTFRSMITYLSNLETEIYIRVHAFNETVDVIVDNILITKDNYSEIISKIDNLHADKSTNIGDALTQAGIVMEKYSIERPTHQIVHIFMTDGEATHGVTNENELIKMVNTTFPNNFVGFGLDHNVSLLKKISDLDNSEYLFVDNMENTTMIYGETIHRYLYSAIKNAEIIIENGVIYNWKTNTWDNKLFEPIIVSEVEKIYHIKTNNIENLDIELNGVIDNDPTNIRLIDTIEVMPDLMILKPNHTEEPDSIIDEDNYDIVPTNLSKYMFRQRTQELLFISKNIFDKDKDVAEKNIIKTELKSFFKLMRDYMKTNDLLKDKFMVTLCDDISIIYRSFGTSVGLMYSASRATSQGRQQTYNVTPVARNFVDIADIPDFQLNSRRSSVPPKLARGITGFVNNLTQEFNEDTLMLAPLHITPSIKKNETNSHFSNGLVTDKNNFDDDNLPKIISGRCNTNTNTISNSTEYGCDVCEIDDYELSNDITSCYATEGTLNTMRSMSQI